MDALQQKKLNEAKTHIADAEKRYKDPTGLYLYSMVL